MEYKTIKKLKSAKQLILLAWIIAVAGAFTVMIYGSHASNTKNFALPLWGIVPFIIASTLMLVGLLKGSRGVGVPLDTERFFSLLLGYPCWIPFLIYLIMMIIFPVIPFH